MSDKKPPEQTLTDELADELKQTREELQRLQAQVERGLRFCHVMGTNNQLALGDLLATMNGLGHVLASGGSISTDAVQDAKQAYANVERQPRFRARVGLDVDKYGADAQPVEIDCEQRWDLCRAACCRLGFVLGTQDLEEGKLQWDYGHPYVIRKDAAGWCVHLDNGCRCEARDFRPLSCRRYDCRSNADIWIDFDRRIPNPKLLELPPLQRDHASSKR